MPKLKKIPLKKDLKFWIYHNVKSFYKSDPYFKNFSTDVLLGQLKGVLIDSSTSEELTSNLRRLDINKPFKLFRKMDGENPLYFKYPSLDFQVESLLRCWEEIKIIEKEIRHFNGTGNDAEANINLFSDGENSYSDDIQNSFLFGLRPSLINYYRIEDEDDVSLYSFEMSKVGTIRSDYKVEYDAFRKSVRHKTATVAKNEGVGFFFQTDIKKFYHSISPEIAIRFLKDHYPKAKEMIKCLQQLEEEKESELPIGWIISGTIAYLILMKFHEILKVSLPKYVEDLNIEKLKNTNIEITSYVDDFIFITKTSSLLNNKEKIELEKCMLKCSEDIFEYLLGKKVVYFHEGSFGGKNKAFDITPAFAEIVDSNFFDFITGTSINDTDGLDIFDELMLPGDNNLIINDKVQFLKSISSAKNRMDEIVKSQQSEFNQIFKKVIYKLDTDGMKYIQSVISFLGVYFNELKIQGKYSPEIFIEKITMIEDRVFSVKNVSSDLVIKYFLSLKKIIYKESPEELRSFVDSFRKCKKLIKSNPHCTIFDFSLIEMLSEQIRAEFLIHEIKSVDFRITKEDSALPFFSSYQRFVDIVSISLGHTNLNVELGDFEVFTAVEAMKKVYGSLSVTEKEDFLVLAVSKLLEHVENKKRFFNLLIPEVTYLFISSLTLKGRSDFLLLVRKYKDYDPVFEEIIYQLENTDEIRNIIELNSNKKISYFLSSLGFISGDQKKKNKFSKLSCFFSSFDAHKKFLLEGVVFLSYSMNCNDIDNFWRILFFRYTSIDSSFHLSWKGQSDTFSPASLKVGTLLKMFLREKYSSNVLDLRKSLNRISSEGYIVKGSVNDIVTYVKFDDLFLNLI